MSSGSCLLIRLNWIFAKCCRIRVFLPYWVKTGYKTLIQKRLFFNISLPLHSSIFVYSGVPQTPHQSEILSPETNSTCVERHCIMVLSRLKLLKLCFKLVHFQDQLRWNLFVNNAMFDVRSILKQCELWDITNLTPFSRTIYQQINIWLQMSTTVKQSLLLVLNVQ